MLQLKVNGQSHPVAVKADALLLWTLHDGLRLTRTRHACAVSPCGAFVVPADSESVRSLPIRLHR